ncbi:hypothetical protein M426DRAFT_26136 [Hypoxylon sp. CI-4A]|nr:hypothetical protein M426DRAFT_26136 [Hypoxylon sp. CI-4A]
MTPRLPLEAALMQHAKQVKTIVRVKMNYSGIIAGYTRPETIPDPGKAALAVTNGELPGEWDNIRYRTMYGAITTGVGGASLLRQQNQELQAILVSGRYSETLFNGLVDNRGDIAEVQTPRASYSSDEIASRLLATSGGQEENQGRQRGNQGWRATQWASKKRPSPTHRRKSKRTKHTYLYMIGVVPNMQKPYNASNRSTLSGSIERQPNREQRAQERLNQGHERLYNLEDSVKGMEIQLKELGEKPWEELSGLEKDVTATNARSLDKSKLEALFHPSDTPLVDPYSNYTC